LVYSQSLEQLLYSHMWQIDHALDLQKTACRPLSLQFFITAQSKVGGAPFVHRTNRYYTYSVHRPSQSFLRSRQQVPLKQKSGHALSHVGVQMQVQASKATAQTHYCFITDTAISCNT
jgi:hypothetical protein